MNTQKSFSELRTMGSLVPKQERFKKTIKDLKEGSFIKVNSLLCKVVAVFNYKSGGDEWFEYELFEIKTGRTFYIEYEEDDHVDMYITTKTIKQRDFPVSMDAIEDMSDEEEGSVIVDGMTFYYEDDYKATFSRNGKSEKLYMYEFENENGTKFLSIEEWGNDQDGYEYQIFISEKLDMIEVLSV